MSRMTILYELPQEQEDVIPLEKNEFDTDVPDEYLFGPGAVTYNPESEHWEFLTHYYPSEQSRSAATYRIRVPRHRIVRVVLEEPYPDWEATDHDEPIPEETQAQRLVYEADTTEEPPTVVDSAEDELLEPIRYDEKSHHWRYRCHVTSYVSGEGHTFTYSHWIPRERVY